MDSLCYSESSYQGQSSSLEVTVDSQECYLTLRDHDGYLRERLIAGIRHRDGDLLRIRRCQTVRVSTRFTNTCRSDSSGGLGNAEFRMALRRQRAKSQHPYPPSYPVPGSLPSESKPPMLRICFDPLFGSPSKADTKPRHSRRYPCNPRRSRLARRRNSPLYQRRPLRFADSGRTSTRHLLSWRSRGPPAASRRSGLDRRGRHTRRY